MAATVPPLDTLAPAWAALRCQSGQTLALVDELVANELPGWSPRLAVRYRVPRRRRTEVRVLAALPSFVFVPFPACEVALALGARGKVPRNWAFTFNGTRPILPVGQLLAMDTTPSRPSGELYKPGERVRIVVGPLHGLTGTIAARKGRDRWAVDLDLGRRVLVPSFLISATDVKSLTG